MHMIKGTASQYKVFATRMKVYHRIHRVYVTYAAPQTTAKPRNKAICGK